MPTQAERTGAAEQLLELIAPGDMVYTVLRHVSRSGMTRVISLLIARDNEILDISYLASRVVGYPLDYNRGGIKVPGTGMDMGFHLVHSLGRRLWPQGFETPPGYWRNDEVRHYEPDGGYALRYRWL